MGPLLRFNLYLFVLCALLCGSLGCKTTESTKKKKKDKEATTMRFHLEVNPDGTPWNAPVPIYREKPVMVNVYKQPFLDEGNIASASVVDTVGGFAIKVQFDQHGSLALDQATTLHRGQRIAVYSQFTDARWLAAPQIKGRISNGELIFTPDATRDEANRIVLGLNNVAQELRKKYTW